ncbi:DUF3995 domain-containing protein [Streptomyces sp. NPDC057702]|uniref:DUF3995 domain-containing protein n=1 Tax=unclassified Streptomyces TaxID=2593676 RepID=UPI0036C2517C
MASPARRLPPYAAWCGYAACGSGVLYALCGGYWAAGGSVGLETVGGALERRARAREPGMVSVLRLTAALKLTAAALGPAVVRDGRRGLSRPPLRALCWAATAVLVAYGGLLTSTQALAEAGVFDASGRSDGQAFHWHLYLWDPWFLGWGLLLGAATYGAGRPVR